MAAMFAFEVAPDGGEPYRVEATSRDISHWERVTKGASLARLEQPRMSDLEAIAHVASVRRGLYDGSLADFRASCDVIVRKPDEDGEDGEDGEVGPTRPAR